MFSFFLPNSKTHFNKILDYNSAVIQALEFDSYVTSKQSLLLFLKHCGLRDFSIMISFIFLLVILAETKTVRRSLDILPVENFSPLNFNVLLGSIL